MSEPFVKQPRLEAASPFELRVDLARHVPESDVRSAISTGEVGFLHSFTTGSTLDGPGVRVVAWLTGCQFRCLYCHNPDTWNMMNGIPVPLKNAIDQLRKYRHGLKAMKGGLTVSGGEPLMQQKFVVNLFSAAKEMGIHTALDTNGFLGGRLTEQELQLVDLVLLDVKSWDAERHLRLTGVTIGPVLDFARRLASLRRPVWIRFVLVPGVTDHAADVAEIASFASSLGNVERVDVLPFHQMGAFKWARLGLAYQLSQVESPSVAAVDRVVSVFKEAGLKAY